MNKKQLEKWKKDIENMSPEEMTELQKIFQSKCEGDIPSEAMGRLISALENPNQPSESAINSLRWSMANDPILVAGEYNISDTMEATLREVYKRSFKRDTSEQLKFVLGTKKDGEKYYESLLQCAIKNAKRSEGFTFADAIGRGILSLNDFVERYAWEEIEEAYDAELHKTPITKICEYLNHDE